MSKFLPKPSRSQPDFTRALAIWRADERREAPRPEAGERDFGMLPPERTWSSYAPYAVAALLALGAGAAAASLATAPKLTDTIETVAAVDARAMGLDAAIDPTGQQKKATALQRDLGALKSEISRLQKALDQSRANQKEASRSAAGQAQANSKEVDALKSEIASLQKTLDTTRDAAVQKIDGLNAKLDQSKGGAAELAELRQRLERFEKFARTDKTPAPRGEAQPAPKEAAAPETTGSVNDRRERDVARAEPAEQPPENPRDAGGQIVRNWTVREVVRGVALLEGRQGMIEVVRGARAPGMGRVRSIERRDGQWVVVTDRGIVVERGEM